MLCLVAEIMGVKKCYSSICFSVLPAKFLFSNVILYYYYYFSFFIKFVSFIFIIFKI